MDLVEYIKDNDRNKFWKLSNGVAQNLLDEAIDRIADLEAQLAAAQERERWIPVTERVPENDGYYLAFAPGWEHAWQCEFASPWWYDCCDEPPITPTYWRELPDPQREATCQTE